MKLTPKTQAVFDFLAAAGAVGRTREEIMSAVTRRNLLPKLICELGLVEAAPESLGEGLVARYRVRRVYEGAEVGR